MKLPRRQFLCLAASAAAVTLISIIPLLLSGHSGWSQTRTIKIINPFPAGGGADILARVVAEHIGRTHGLTALVENRVGAATQIGTEAVSRAAPDGNTLLLITPNLVITPHLRKVNYDPLTSFEPICDLVELPMVLVVNSASPYRTLADLVNAARMKPGDLTLAGPGPATFTHIAFEMLKRAANIQLTFIPYPGGAPAANALLGQHVATAFADYASFAEQLKSNNLRALAVGTRARIDELPEVPTVAESGYKDYEVNLWYGIFAPAKTPKEVVSELVAWFRSAVQAPEVKGKLVAQGYIPVGTCGADFGALVRKQYDDYGRVIREAKIKAE